ncbi:MAG: hypothetical protein AB8C84_08945 [Oligoflexales bacterium]
MSLRNYILSFVLSLSANAYSNNYFRVQPKNIHPAEINVYTNGNDWIVQKDHQNFVVQHFDIDTVLRQESISTVSKIMRSGFIRVVPCGETYKIYYQARGIGGGPLAGYIGYWATKAISYGAAAAGATGALAAAGVTGSGIAGASAGAAAVATATAGAVGVTAGAAEVVAGAAIVAEGAVGFVAAVESASLSIGAVLTACPFLP